MNSIKKLVTSLEPFYPAVIGGADLDPVQEIPEKESTDPEELVPEVPIETPPGFLSRTIQALLSIPYNLFIRPLLLVWLLVTFPFAYIFGHGYPEMLPDTVDNTGQPEKSDVEKTELFKREKIMANHVKSPTALSKYILPPPPRLFPLSRNPDKRKRKKTLVLDLDETLIHSLSRGAPRLLGGSGGSSHMIELKVNNVATLYYVYKRPFCDFFLKEISKWFELQIFTASVKEYADPIIDWLESDIVDKGREQGDVEPIFTKRYYRTDCTYRLGVGYIKDLSKFFPKDDDLKNVLILDNSPVSYALHEHNGVMIEGWINDQSDRDLLNLLPMLYSLSLCIDVRFILGMRSGEKLFENL